MLTSARLSTYAYTLCYRLLLPFKLYLYAFSTQRTSDVSDGRRSNGRVSDFWYSFLTPCVAAIAAPVGVTGLDADGSN